MFREVDRVWCRLVLNLPAIQWGTFAVLAIAYTSQAYAAELAWQGEGECQDAQPAVAEIQQLTKASLAEVEGVDFAVQVSAPDPESGSDIWRVRVQTLVLGEVRGEREIEGTTCEEVRQAAAVAIAMAVAEVENGNGQTQSADTQELVSISDEDAPASAAPRSTEDTQPEEPLLHDSSWSSAASLGGALDMGFMPKPALGAQVGVQFRYNYFGLRMYGGLFAAQQTTLVEGAAGRFALWVVGVAACLQPASQSIMVQGCAGFETDYLSAVGVGTLVTPYDRLVWVGALRGELGLGLPVVDSFALWFRGSVAAPLSQPEFVLDGMRKVHRVGNVVGRLALEAELSF